MRYNSDMKVSSKNRVISVCYGDYWIIWVFLYRGGKNPVKMYEDANEDANVSKNLSIPKNPVKPRKTVSF